MQNLIPGLHGLVNHNKAWMFHVSEIAIKFLKCINMCSFRFLVCFQYFNHASIIFVDKQDEGYKV